MQPCTLARHARTYTVLGPSRNFSPDLFLPQSLKTAGYWTYEKPTAAAAGGSLRTCGPRREISPRSRAPARAAAAEAAAALPPAAGLF